MVRVSLRAHSCELWPMKKDVAVVVASHARPETLDLVLTSIVDQRDDLALEIIVVDNPSARSREVASVVSKYEDVHLIQLRRNQGFGRAIGRGVACASAQFLYLACDDVVLAKGSLKKLKAAHVQGPRVGLSAPLLLRADDPEKIQAAGGAFELSLNPRVLIHQALPLGACDNAPCAVTFLPGGTLFVERNYFNALGGYREDFFMYEEDTELCQRVLRSGRTLLVVPSAKAYDLMPPATYDPRRVHSAKIRNFLAMITLHADGRLLPLILARQFVAGVRRLYLLSGSERSTWRRGWREFLFSLPMLLRDRRKYANMFGSSPRARTAPGL